MPNQDEKNKVFYGVIAQNSISSEALDDVFFGDSSTDLNYEHWKEEITTRIISLLEEFGRVNDKSEIVDMVLNSVEYEGDEIDPEFDDGKYKIIKCLDFDLMVLKSPYVTWTPPCSPCVPAAGDLDSTYKHPEIDYFDTKTTQEANEGIEPFYGDYKWRLAYCLGPEWFEEKPSGKWIDCEYCQGTGLRNKSDIPNYNEEIFTSNGGVLFDSKRVKCWVCLENEKYGNIGGVKEYISSIPYPYAPIDENGNIGELVFPVIKGEAK